METVSGGLNHNECLISFLCSKNYVYLIKPS